MTEQTYQDMRRAMVASQLRTTGVNDPRVLAAMSEVARERFVPEARRATAYADAPIPLPGGRALNPPMALGLLLTEARLDGDERTLVIGAGTGYAAAVVSRLVSSVVAVEEDAALAALARAALEGTSVTVVESPLAAGGPDGPYDFVLIDGAVPEVPQSIIDQVADGGQIATGLIERGVTRLAIGRAVSGAAGFITFADAAIAPLPGFSAPQGFSF
ncbi:MAG: protein-L-isoaspartate O-methyltransferase [Sphingomonas sp.]